MTRVDLNCDMGEMPEAIADGSQELLMPHITSVNIACGGHAGDEDTMRRTIDQALRWKLAIGAHPGYPDRANFGREKLDMAPDEVAAFVYQQICALAEIASRRGAGIVHVKPHGALYNQAAGDRELAAAIAQGAARFDRNVVLVGLAGSAMLDEFRGAGFRIAAEAFADRHYEPDGTLRSRKLPKALLTTPEEAAAQALGIVLRGRVLAADGSEIDLTADTICIHGDTPGAVRIAEAVARGLRGSGIELKALGQNPRRE